MMGIKGLSVSSGSACTSASLEPSYVLRALGVEEEMAHTSLRFGLGRFTTEQEVDTAVERAGAPRRQAARDEPALGNGPGRHRHQVDQMGGTLSSAVRRSAGIEESVMAYSDKLIDHYENPRNIGSLDKNDPRSRHRPGRRAGLRRRHEAADQGRPRRADRGRQVQDLRLRLGDRLAARSSPSGSRARRSTRRRRSRTPTSPSIWRCRR